MEKQIIFMFSGQGSQYYRMGNELYDNHSKFRYWMDHCNKITAPLIGISLIDVLYRTREKSDPFDRLLYTNPALLCIQYSLAKVLMDAGIRPHFLLGYSLGEITASVVSGTISLEQGIQLVVEKAQLVEEKTKVANMIAIIESTEIMNKHPELFQNCWLTGKNFKHSFVVSGFPQEMDCLQAELKERNIIFQRLPVQHGFHTEIIDSIEEDFKQLVRNIQPAPTQIPVLSSLENGELKQFTEDYLWTVLRQPVDFEKTILWACDKGDCVFIDVGPSGTLATFVKYILPSNSNSVPLQVMNQFGKDLNSLENLHAHLSHYNLVNR